MEYKQGLRKVITSLTLSRLILHFFWMSIFLFFVYKYKPFFIFLFLLFLASISRTYNHFFWFPQLGLELYSTATILTAYLLGPWPGFFQGALSNFFAYFFSGKFKHYAYIGVSSWAIIGLVCGYLRIFNLNITYVGIGFIILYEAVTMPLFRFSGARTISAIVFTVTHLMIGSFIFSTIVPFLYNLLR